MRERVVKYLTLPDPAATEAVGAALAGALAGHGAFVALRGELGAGKTTLVRGLLRALGHPGAVRSPTYTLVEPYELDGRRVLHVDLYRMADGGELDALGIRDELDETTLLLVEWPERAAGGLPPPDLELTLSHAGKARRLSASPRGVVGARCIQAIEK